ncbi:MAG: DNA replication/repair protein RecF [Candidatus Levyibacteriota bacterium]
MTVTHLTLQHLRNHLKRSFEFKDITIIIGRNTAGKTNILEALSILSHGTSFRAVRDADVIQEGRDFAKIEADVSTTDDKARLHAIFALHGTYLSKKYQVNGVARSLRTFSEYFYTVLFTPQDIEIVTDTPSLRRRYIDSILTKSHKEYRSALSKYEKALRQRNRMLHDAKIGRKEYRRADYEFWENLLIEHGTIIHRFREVFVDYVNNFKKEVFQFEMFYDHSIISTERLFKYHFEEAAAGVTLVGPQRDDFKFFFPGTKKEIKEFGSRGEQRLTILQLKLIEISYLLHATGQRPILLLDDIFSELDAENIDMIYHFIEDQQTIITTTHREFVPKKILKQENLAIIEL